MSFLLPALPYANNALEPHISEKTIDFHYGKHHQAYVNKLNDLIKGSKFEKSSLEDIILNSEGAVFNNAAQIWNHTFYWSCLSPVGGGTPQGKILKAIDENFGSFDKFKEEFTNAAATLFGSGWAWLSMDKKGKLVISQESNAGNPLTKGLKPLLTCDVWEHAYYIDFQNRRPDYIKTFWDLVDWKRVEDLC
jgi:superoxide dismutase, Fe-Mn family